jgi:hypothetical protein
MTRQIIVIVLFAGLLQADALAQTPRMRGARQARLMNLSGEERARLQSAHLAALRDPALRESRERFHQAKREYRDKLRDALLKADPQVQPILEKVRRQRREER